MVPNVASMPRFHRAIPQVGGSGEIVGGYAQREHGVIVHRLAILHISVECAVRRHTYTRTGGISHGTAKYLIGTLHIERLHIGGIDGVEALVFQRPFHISRGGVGKCPTRCALVEIIAPNGGLRRCALHTKGGFQLATRICTHTLGHCHACRLLHLHRRERRPLCRIAYRLCHLCLQREGGKHKGKGR